MGRQEDLIRKITKEKLDKEKLNKANFSNKLMNDGLNKLNVKKGIDREKLSLSEKVIKKENKISNINDSKNQESSNVKLERAENTSTGSISINEKKIELGSDSGVNKIVFGSLLFILLIGVILIIVISSNSGTRNVDEFANNSDKTEVNIPDQQNITQEPVVVEQKPAVEQNKTEEIKKEVDKTSTLNTETERNNNKTIDKNETILSNTETNSQNKETDLVNKESIASNKEISINEVRSSLLEWHSSIKSFDYYNHIKYYADYVNYFGKSNTPKSKITNEKYSFFNSGAWTLVFDNISRINLSYVNDSKVISTFTYDCEYIKNTGRVYSVKVDKRIVWEKDYDGWKIVEEKDLRIIEKRNRQINLDNEY